MEVTRKNIKASSFVSLVYLQILFLNLHGLATASHVVQGNETDQQALLQFKAMITSDQFRVMESWNGSIHFCRWRGVTCGRKHPRVTKLDLPFLKLSGPLSPYIGNLSFLRQLNLVGNSFYNQIPRQIGRLRRLEILDLTNNSISGEIPSNLSACSKLVYVDMRSNQLGGEIPTSLGLLSNLNVLSLTNNSLTGSIPPSFGNLSSLEVLALAINRLTGAIPEALGQLTNLSYLWIGENAISGVAPVSMFNLSRITVFDIGVNNIQGTLPGDLGLTMPNVEHFSVGINQFSGQIPISISNASNLYLLQLNRNRFSGNVPDMQKLDKLYMLQLARNQLGQGSEGDLHFLCNHTLLEILDISANNFGGAFPECISNYSSTLSILVTERNNISGRIPNWIGNLISLELLWISGNQLSGHIPFDIGKLHKLNQFFADTNFLSGAIPHTIGNLTFLTKFDIGVNNLQGSIPSSLGKCQNLLQMNLSRNNLSGPIPPQVLTIPSMTILLDLSSNHLTGELPVEVGNLKNLGEFHVSRNKLSGLLPNNLGSCLSLEKLLLDGNLFEGSIPSSLSSLRGLKEFDVSNNNLSGGVPEFLVSFGVLKYLNLSFNDFEGVLPSEGVFKNASDIFVEGNGKLCGGIPELDLSKCNSRTSTTRSNTSRLLIVVIVVVILGVTLFFTCFFVLWFRKKNEKLPTTTFEANSLLELSYHSILRATDGFSMQKLLGSGSFGSVYKGILEASGATIAVKVLNLLNRGASRSFLAECEALKNVRHRNLVKILTAISGVDYQGNDFKALIYEFMENGSLEDWLHTYVGMNEPETRRKLNFSQRVSVAIDVAHALEYLHHHCETSIIHCDLKPSNILLDEEMVGHISDFGLAKLLYADGLDNSLNQSSSLGLRGTIGYAPPEYGMGSELSTKGDVYSYGILLLEMFSGKRPTDEKFKEGLSLHNFIKTALPERMIEITDPILMQERVGLGTITNNSLRENSLRNENQLQCLLSIFEIGLTCSAESPSQRITMSEVVVKLCSIRDKQLHPTQLRRAVRT